MASSTAPIKIILKITKPTSPRLPAIVNLTPTDVKNLVGALSNTKDEIKIDHEGMKQALGLSSKSSASKIWSRLRKKLSANQASSSTSASAAPATADEGSDEDEEDDDDNDDDDTAADEVPAKNSATAPAAKRSCETDEDEDNAGPKAGKKARKST